MPSGRGQSLELFFIDGRPDGMLTAEIFNWTGHVLMTPRLQITEALQRKEAKHTGVYILLGENQNGKPLAYIGESEDVSDRIRSHDASRDWWTSAILITTSADVLHKAHVKYLEARLVEEARKAGRLELANGNTPPRSSLSESATTNMEQFIEHILLILPALRVDGILRKTRAVPQSAGISPASGAGASIEDEFELTTPKHGVQAKARLVNGEFIVQPGSVARLKWEGTPTHSYRNLFEELVGNGVLEQQGNQRVFKQAYAFKSPSAAGAVLNGRATNGPESWRVSGNPGKTFSQWEAEQLARTAASALSVPPSANAAPASAS